MTEALRLLIVDDEEQFRQVLVKRLSRRGMVPEQAGSGEDCLDLLEKKPMDVVILDVKMPGMDGLEVLQRIKEKYDKTEVILLTGYANTQDGVEGIKSGAFDYLSKPVELDHLAGKIKQAHEKILHEAEREREAEFREKMEQRMVAAERLASLGTLAAGVAHEINNPLAIINDSVGWMQLLINQGDASEIPIKGQLEKGLDKIAQSVERAKKITHQLLGFARRSDPIISEVDLKQLAEDTVQLVEKEAKHKEIEFMLESDPSLGKIWSDAYQLRQVLLNLITNAIHATGSRGRIEITLQKDGELVILAIKDTGQGIPQENMERVFEPFFSTKPTGEGTGLGLFVTRGIVEKLGGAIEVDSRMGEGTTFRVRLPRAHKIDERSEPEERTNRVEKATVMTGETPSAGKESS
jgi:two-component system NtrC family sensor kinase